MENVIEKDGKWFADNGEEFKRIPKTRRAEHLINNNGEVIAKRCGGFCGEMLPIERFHRCSKGFAKKRSYCMECELKRFEANAKGLNVYGEEKRPIKPKAEREYDENGTCIRKVCPRCEEWHERSDFYQQSSSVDGLGTNCRSCCTDVMRVAMSKDPERYKTYQHNRRAKEAALPGDLSDEQWKGTLEFFDDSCALTGEGADLHLEHAIPIAIGHGGTVNWNCYPLVGSLNTSKNASNLFEWARGRDDIDKPKFNRLITFLANQCELTVDEYRVFYYWCFANPRLTVEEIEVDGDVDSLTLWKRSLTKNT